MKLGWRDRQHDDYGATDNSSKPELNLLRFLPWVLGASVMANFVMLFAISGFSDINTDATSRLNRIDAERIRLEAELSAARTAMEQLEAVQEEASKEIEYLRQLVEQQHLELERNRTDEN